MCLCKKNLIVFMTIGLLFIGFGLMNSCKSKKAEETNLTQHERAPDIKKRVEQFSPTELSIDESILSDEQKLMIDKLIQASRHIDTIFWKQASSIGLSLKAALEESEDPSDKDYLEYLKIHYGPFDRLDAHKPFLGTEAKPPGAAMYPPDMTKEEFQQFISDHPEAKQEFESPYTVIRRKNGELTAVPYNEEYREDLEPAAQLLKEAAEITTNDALKKYLNQRAEDLLSNDYYQSDYDWIDLEGNLVEIVIGPYEVYEDNLMGLKAAYESFVYVNDQEEMKKIQGYIEYLDEMQKNLPVEKKYKDQTVAGLKSPLNVVYEVYTAGDTRAGVQTLAFVLPNDEKVREEKGTKKVMLKNMMEAKFKKALVPISQKVLSPEDAENVSFYAYFNQIILHELCHALGVNYVTLPDGSKTTVNKVLKENYSAIEESKADVLGMYNIQLLMEKGWIPRETEVEFYTTYLAGIFRSLRFGLHEAHGLGTLIQFNFMMEKGAFIYDEDSGQFKLNMDKIKGAIEELAQKLLIIEGDGNYDNAAAFLMEYSKVDPVLEKTIERLEDIPVDIKPIFPMAETQNE